MNLENYRKQLDDIDNKLAILFEKRMEIIENVRQFKKQNNLPIYDKNREQKMANSNANLIKNKDFLPYYIMFLENCTKVSKQYMQDKN